MIKFNNDIMNASEYSGLKQILNYLSTDDLLSVMGTTTKHLVKAETPDEAIQVIIEYSPKASTVLRRKKITRTILFDYLYKHGITVPPTSEKPTLITACLKLWVSSDAQQNSSLNDLEEDVQKVENTSVSSESSQLNFESEVSHGSVSELGLQFAKWFFDSLNLQNNFGSQHFWPDCKFWLHSKFSGMKEEDFCIMGSNNVASHLSNYVTSKRYFFKPNVTTTGVQTAEEQHGLIKISVSGVIHQFTNCIGLFDFVFGLVSDPMFNDNWKIKQLSLVIQVNDNSGNAVSCYTQSVPYLCQ